MLNTYLFNYYNNTAWPCIVLFQPTNIILAFLS